MTRNATFGALVFALLMVTTGLAGVVAAAPTSGTASSSSAAPLAQETTTQANETANVTASITVEDQNTNGSVLVVNQTNLSEGGFVVVFAQNGTILGNSTYLEPGAHENVTVNFNTSIATSQVLVAVPHKDTNDNQLFEFNATRAQEVGPANATDGPYLERGIPVSTVVFVTVGNDTARRQTTTASMAAPER